MQRLIREQPAGLFALSALWLGLALTTPAFFRLENMRDLAISNAPVLLVAIGMTLVVILGEIDLSVGSTFAIVSVVCGALATWGWPAPFLAIAAVLTGGWLGAVNGLLVARLRAPSIVVTLATMAALREALRWITGGAWLENLPPTFQWFGLGQQAGQAAILGGALIIFAALTWSSRKLPAFRFIFATGSDREAARLAGIDVANVALRVFMLLGALTGIAALLNAVRFSDVPANSGIGLELKAIAAVVVGGTPITGGRGSLSGTFCGVLLLGSIGPALTFLGSSPYWEKAIQGVIILATVVLGAWTARRSLIFSRSR